MRTFQVFVSGFLRCTLYSSIDWGAAAFPFRLIHLERVDDSFFPVDGGCHVFFCAECNLLAHKKRITGFHNLVGGKEKRSFS